MKNIVLALALAVVATSAGAAGFDKNDPEVCAKIAAEIKAGNAAAKAAATQMQNEGVCSAKQLGL